MNKDLVDYLEKYCLEVPCSIAIDNAILRSFVVHDVIFTVQYNKEDISLRKIIKKERYE